MDSEAGVLRSRCAQEQVCSDQDELGPLRKLQQPCPCPPLVRVLSRGMRGGTCVNRSPPHHISALHFCPPRFVTIACHCPLFRAFSRGMRGGCQP